MPVYRSMVSCHLVSFVSYHPGFVCLWRALLMNISYVLGKFMFKSFFFVLLWISYFPWCEVINCSCTLLIWKSCSLTLACFFLSCRHIFLGFSKCGRYVLSYTSSSGDDDFSFYIYHLYWWEFNVHSKLKMVWTALHIIYTGLKYLCHTVTRFDLLY